MSEAKKSYEFTVASEITKVYSEAHKQGVVNSLRLVRKYFAVHPVMTESDFTDFLNKYFPENMEDIKSDKMI